MSTYKIYHNSRCGKSREGLALLSKFTNEYEVIDYIKNPLTIAEIEILLKQLNIKPIELVRTKEIIWKELTRDKTLNDNEIINALAKFPKLIERPIVVKEDVAIIGRPTEKITFFLSK